MEEKEVMISFTKEEWCTIMASCGVTANIMLNEPSIKDMAEAAQMMYIMKKVANVLRETEK